MEPTTPTLGLAHLLAQGDAVGKTLLATLVLMSMASIVFWIRSFCSSLLCCSFKTTLKALAIEWVPTLIFSFWSRTI